MVYLYVVSCAPLSPHAATLSEQKSQYDAKISAAEQELSELKRKKASQDTIAKALQKQLDDLSGKIYIVQNQADELDLQVSSLKAEIKSLNKQIIQTQKNINEKNEQITATAELFCKRLRANYISGPTSILEILLTSEDFSTMLNRLELMKRITEADQKLVDRLKGEIGEAEALKEALTSKKEAAEIKSEELSAKRMDLEMSKAEYEAAALEIDKKSAEVNMILYGIKDDIDKMSDNIQEFEAAQKEIIEAIKKYEKEKSSKKEKIEPKEDKPQKVSSSSSGWLWPVPAGHPTSSFGWRTDPISGVYKFHSGLDIAAACGSDIIASRAGTVVFIKHWTTLYGNHILLHHDNGYYTLYAHCLPSFTVSEGDHVSKGQVIAHVGTSGYSTGYHCHFEVRDSLKNRVNPSKFVYKQ